MSNHHVNNFKFLTPNNLSYKLINMNMAERIKHRMQEINMTQEELGKQVGLTQPAIFKLLSGKTKRTTRLAEIAQALKTRPEWLITGAPPMQDAISPDERGLLEDFRKLDPAKRPVARMTIRAMLPEQSQAA